MSVFSHRYTSVPVLKCLHVSNLIGLRARSNCLVFKEEPQQHTATHKCTYAVQRLQCMQQPAPNQMQCTDCVCASKLRQTWPQSKPQIKTARDQKRTRMPREHTNTNSLKKNHNREHQEPRARKHRNVAPMLHILHYEEKYRANVHLQHAICCETRLISRDEPKKKCQKEIERRAECPILGKSVRCDGIWN